jgi:uncharacterized membrane protein YhhN
MIQLLEYLYWIIAALEIYSEASGNSTLRFFTKPLLMIVLILFYARSLNTGWSGMHKMMIAAFAFSWVGDVALMFSGEKGELLMGIAKDPNFFLVGLVGFLITHVLYTISFSKVTNAGAEALLPKKFWVFIPLVIYMGVLLMLLVPSIGSSEATKPFLIPVLVYSTAIATMVVFAINRHGRVNDATFKLVVLGALLFMVSDSIIAINKFMQPFATAGIFIMVLYIAGQYFIAKGMLAFDEKSR